ncbi:pseudaminic acid cytidylyltransferase [Massilia sp. Root418]|uniref:pseudaminic acid cytidylyltransferase n=1 Tax=Massilia sp. Root418 TaxID=1736532 RepID=UPI0006F5B7ED|nr:pseudaminic acid cytidylyltransferase [Massilia sp. Root418]KQW99904.1 pseudaminic acid cytidylyltransferase [Massilia sp. Root418]
MRIAIIPARGGSKRIPRKNIRAFAGQPLIAYSIKAARESGLFDHVIVSTDDEEIAAIARAHGAETPFTRPAELANDHATTVPVIRQAVQWVQEHMGPVEQVCCIYATAPFLQASALREAHALFEQRKVGGYVFSATSFPFPIQRSFKLNAEGLVEMFWPEHYNTRSQDLEHAYQDAGQFYWGSAQSYLDNKIFFSTDSMAYLLPRHMVQDIDTPEDWTRAELMYAALRQNGDIA